MFYFSRTALAISLFLLFVPLVCGQNSDLDRDLAAKFAAVNVVSLDAAARVLSLKAGTKNVQISLKQNDIRSSGFRAMSTGADGTRAIEAAPSNTFDGNVQGEPESFARFSITRRGWAGMFEADGSRYFLESAVAFSESARDGDYVVYRAGDLLRHDPVSCGTHLIDKVEKAAADASQNAVPTAMQRLDLAIDSDFEYVNIFGSVAAANSEILGILNVVDGLYESELRISLSVVFQHAWTTPDPFAAFSPEQTVRNFQAHWNANFPVSSVPRDTAHLFSGKGNVQGQGWAFIGVVCNNAAFSYGMSGYVNFVEGQRLVTAHEIAHNLGANHVGAAQGCANTLMNAGLSGDTPLTFCQFSRNEIAGHLAANGGCMSNTAPCAFDFDGDARTDLSIYRPVVGQWWYLRSSDGGGRAVTFGNAADRTVPADYTGDGKTDVAIFRASTGEWFILRSEDSSFYGLPFGTNGDTPVPGDFDADGKADVAVFRGSSRTWFVSRSGDGGTTISGFGNAGDLPVNADYDGDGRSDIAIYRPSVGQWWIERTSGGTVALQFGISTDRAVPRDYTGDGKADVAIFRPASGSWSILRSEDQSFYSFPYGNSTDIPSPGDYDGDGKYDAAIFRPTGATWFANLSSGGNLIQQFGASGDIPIPSAFVR